MAKTSEPEAIDPNTVYSVALRLPGKNLAEIMKGLPPEFSTEQAILFRVFHDSLPRSFSVKHFLAWYEAFAEALPAAEVVRVTKRMRLQPSVPAPVAVKKTKKPAPKKKRSAKR